MGRTEPLSCPECPFTTSCRTSLSRHRAARHSHLRPHACSHCPLTFKLKSILTRHVLRRHVPRTSTKKGPPPPKALSCPHCSFRTAYNGSLKDHLRRHSDELLSCDLCSYRTKSGKNLSKHRLHHLRGKRFRCSQCPYATTERASLTKHMALHTGERRQTCATCDYSTSDRSNMARHRRLYCKTSLSAEPAPAVHDGAQQATNAIVRDSSVEVAAVVLTVDANGSVTPQAITAVDPSVPSGRQTRRRLSHRRLAGRGKGRPPPSHCPASSAPDTYSCLVPDGAKEEQMSAFTAADPRTPQMSSPLLRAFEKIPPNRSSRLPVSCMNPRPDEKEAAFAEISIEPKPTEDMATSRVYGSEGFVPPLDCSDGTGSTASNHCCVNNDYILDSLADFREIWLMPLENCVASSSDILPNSLLQRNFNSPEPPHSSLNDVDQARDLTETNLRQVTNSQEGCSINLVADNFHETETGFSLLNISSEAIDAVKSDLSKHILPLSEDNELLPCAVSAPTLEPTIDTYSGSSGGTLLCCDDLIKNNAQASFVVSVANDGASDGCGVPEVALLAATTDGREYDMTETQTHALESSYSDITISSPTLEDNNAVEINNLHLNEFGSVVEISTTCSPLPAEQFSGKCHPWVHSCGPCAIDFPSLDALIEHKFLIHNLMVPSTNHNHVENETNTFSSLRAHGIINPKCLDSTPAPLGYNLGEVGSKTALNTVFQSTKDVRSVEPKPERTQECVLDEIPNQRALKNTSKKCTQAMLDCLVCGFKTNKKRVYRAHFKLHRTEKPFQCSLCEFRSKYKNSLKVHVKLKHEPRKDEIQKTPPNILSCRHCDFTSTHKSSLRRHLKRHSLDASEQAPQLRCQHCDQLFGDRISLLHHSAFHSNEKRFACSICGYRSDFTTILKAHVARHLRKLSSEVPAESTILQHTNITPVVKEKRPALVCKLCPYTCRNRSSMNKHRNKAHPNHGSIRCPVCSFHCDDLRSLHSHTVSHLDELPHACTKCGYRCRTRYLLTKHEQKHSNEKTVYSCHKCSFMTSSKSSIVLHMKYHPERKEYTSLRMDTLDDAGRPPATSEVHNETTTTTITVATD